MAHPLEKAIAQDSILRYRPKQRQQKLYTIVHDAKCLRPSCALRDAVHYYFYNGAAKRSFDVVKLTLMTDFYKLMSTKLDNERPICAKKFIINLRHDLRKHQQSATVNQHMLRQFADLITIANAEESGIPTIL